MIKAGVFISHIAVEKSVALKLQEYIRKAFGASFPVFVASDQTSIGGGRKWFNHIIDNLRVAKVVLVLVSQDSCQREWINFEAGFGDGAEAAVIPIAIKDFDLGKLGFPLSGYNGRPVENIEGILSDIARETGLVNTPIDTLQYREEMRAMEDSLIYKNVVVTPHFRPNGPKVDVAFKIENLGNTDLDLIMLEAWVPFEVTRPDFYRPTFPSMLKFTTDVIDGKQYWWAQYSSSFIGNAANLDALRSVLTRSMGTLSLPAPLFGLIERFQEVIVAQSVFTHIHVRNLDTTREQHHMRDLNF